MSRRAGCRFTFGAAAVLAAPLAVAQPAFDLTLGGSLAALDETAFGASTRGLAHGTLGLEQRFDERRGRLGYTLDAGTYATTGDWRSFLHTAEAVYRIDLAAEQRGSVFLGASGALRDNGEAWGQADYRAFGLMANTQWRVGGATLRGGYRFDLRRFPDLAALDQEQHDAFASVLVNLPSRTTLIGEAHAGLKSYAGETLTVAVPDDPAEPATTGRGGRGRGTGSLGPDVRPSFVTLGDATQARQIHWLARVAQSLADRTGLSLQYSERHAWGRVPPALVTTPAGFFDDGVYDDPFASDARAGRVALKHVFANGGSVEAWGTRLRRDFTGTAALGLDGQPLATLELRRDRVWRAGAALRQPLRAPREGALRLALELAYDFSEHRSNDAYYDYRAHTVGVALRFAY